jgi:hypothetical protein
LKGAEDVFSSLKQFIESGREKVDVDEGAEKICIELCKNPQGIEEQLKQLQQALSELPRIEFHRDIEDLLKSFCKAKKEVALELVDTNHWQDLFLSGTEVLGSCQRVDGSPKVNQGLLAYVMDGKNRMIALREKKSGKIVARGLFRLLLTENSHQPILFLDRLYPPACPSEWKEALVDFARKRAKILNCPLATLECEKEERQLLENIVSLGSRSPYEYEDGAGGIKRKGVFTISNGVKMIG